MQRDIYTLPVGKTISTNDLTLDDILGEQFQDLQTTLTTNKVTPARLAQEINMEEFAKSNFMNVGPKVTEEDLLIENILGGGGIKLDTLLKEIQEDKFKTVDFMLSSNNDRKSQGATIVEEIIEEKEKPLHIITYVDQLEREPYTAIHREQNVDHTDFFSQYKETLEKDRIESFRFLPESKIKLMDDFRIQTASQLGRIKESPKCIQYYFDHQKEIIAVGLSRSSIILYIIKLNTQFQPGKPVILPIDNTVKTTPITCIEFSDNGSHLISSNFDGQFLLYSLQPATTPKLLKTFSQAPAAQFGVPIGLQVFGEQMVNSSYFNFVTCDTFGSLQANKIRQTTFSYGLEKNLIFSKSLETPLHQITRQLIQIPEQNLKLEALATVNHKLVQVVILEPFLDRVFLKEFVPRGQLEVRWQTNTNNVSNEKTLMVVANGGEFYMIMMSCARESKKVDIKFEIVSHIQLGFEANSVHWLSQNILFVKYGRVEYYLIDTSHFTPGDFKRGEDRQLLQDEDLPDEEREKLNKDRKLAMVVAGTMETQVQETQFPWNNKYKLQTYTLISRRNRLVYLESTNLDPKYYFVYKELSLWDEFIEMKIDSREWNYCLALLLQMYDGQARYFAGLTADDSIRKNQMRPHLNSFIMKYIQHVATFEQHNDPKSEMESWKKTTQRAVEFLTRADSMQYLFLQLRPLYQKMKKDQIFLDSLQRLIMRNRIKYIPREALKDVMTHLRQKKEIQTLKQLIINLDTDQIDPTQIVQICIDFNLFTPLVYISPRFDDDYFTPIAKMIATYQSLTQEYQQIKGNTFEEFQTNLILNQTDQTMIQQFLSNQVLDINKCSQQQILKEIQMQGYKCLWYLQLCFQGHMFPRDEIPRNRWGQVLIYMMILTFAEETLTLLLALDPIVTFDVLLNLFHEQQLSTLNQCAEDAISSLRAAYKRNNRVSLNMHQQEQTVLSVILEVLYEQVDQVKYKGIFQLFLSEVFLLCPDVPIKYAMDAINHMLKYPSMSLADEALQSSHRFLTDNKKYVLHKDDESILIRKENAICSYLILNKQNFDKYLLDEVLQNASESPLQNNYFNGSVEVRSLVLFQKNQYIESVEQFIRSIDGYQRMKVFNYIDKILWSNIGSKKEEQLMKFIIANIRELVSINAEKCTLLLNKTTEQDFKEAILRLNDFPQLKLQLLDQIVQKKRAAKETLEDRYMVEYFELICKYRQDQVQSELRRGDLPQDPCLNLCRKYNIQTGEAYLLEKSGSVIGAIELYFSIFIAKLNGYFQQDSIILTDQEQLLKQMLLHIEPCLEICRENNKKGDFESEQNWFLLIDRISKSRNKYKGQPNSRYVLQNFTEIYQLLLQEVLNKVELKSVFDHLESIIGHYYSEEVRMTFQLLLKGYSYEEFLLKSTLDMIREDVALQDQDHYYAQSRAIVIQPYPQTTNKCYVHKFCENIVSIQEMKTQSICKYCKEISENSFYINLRLAEIKVKAANQKRRISIEHKPNQYDIDQDDIEDIQQENQESRELKQTRLTKLKTFDIDKEDKWDLIYTR